MSTRWNDAVEARLNELSLVTTGLDGMLESLTHAVDIAKAGGITDERLYATLHLAGTRQMTPSTEAVLANAGIDTTPWAVVTGEQRMVRSDAIVIERADVPEVTPSGGCSGVGVHFLSAAGHEIADTSDAELVRVHALALLAIAEYLAAHPPVPPVSDEDVETLGESLRWESRGVKQGGATWAFAADRDEWRALARRLLATGRVSVTK